MSATQPAVRAIGAIESCFREKFGAPRQPRLVPASRARLRIKLEFIPEQSLKGLAGFSHVWLLAYFHLNTNKRFLSTVHPPRLKGKTVGVFASRSPHRPSPIGLSLARLLAVEGDTLELAEIDLIDGTPIVDVKPYIPAYDCVAEALPGWTERADARELKVEFAAGTL
ncbi:MAG: tRNA (N6-threonylcarbamoyladenosine(37)-N6)-methyltransferase TrmO, partial [Elusimicrobia bacterium]|nr:tRNA (N6-threonylcarbamoyladenosine(37)-N6)-methyltransferase TrmO [Elusimicrobiota bacterium]